MTKEKDIPELRFPEFTGEWKNLRTGDIAPLQRGFDLPTTDVKKGKYPVVYSNGSLRKHNEYKADAPGVVTGRSGTIGKVTFVNENYWPHNTSLWVTDFKGNFPKYIYYFYINFKLERYNAGSTVPTLNRNDVHSVKKSIPQPQEQQKIATFLTAVDQRIKLLQKKKGALEEYKKGVMQKIFSQEIRFRDENGNDFPAWEEKRLGEILEYEQPTKYLVKDTEYKDEYTIPVLTAGKTFLLGYTNEKHGIFNENLPTIIFDDFTTAFQFVDFPFKAKSSAMKMLIPKYQNVNIRFVFEVMKTIKFPLAEHKRYWISEYQREIIPYPSFEEQEKISSFLSSLDNTLESINIEIDKSKEFKKGLLQKMFV